MVSISQPQARSSRVSGAKKASSGPRLLSSGRRGKDVRAVQNRLRAAGHKIAADGIFGPKTARAVRDYQQANGLKIDGIVGPQTRGSFNAPFNGAGGQNGIPRSNGAPRPNGVDPSTPGTTPGPFAGGTGTAAAIDRALGGVLRGQGQAFVEAAQKYGIDPRLLAAISMHETGNGTSRFARELNNVGGIMDPKQNWQRGKRFGSMQEGIDYMARNLKRNYFDKGLRTLPQIQQKYAPVGARNDPGNLNRHWVSGVQKYMGMMR